ncbi:putative ABC exporter domain-containing protein [Papillibacter cinnamivorans]|uniref:Putative ABC exporter n=1 Tax=Papillibacter cinnamivorans DSM 12816 TaxID=1122930 RepID=A0A1W2BJD7_9FIRM|nr:putative ABC exporter domain-containing protein [Papillibacter cinnamivorans]SMC72578.1 Putative ABC exporter [Papillibacter cinnamivorans DSM 12816]
MNSLVFLVSRSLKNSFLELLRKPAKLILWLFVIAMVVGFFILSLYTRQSAEIHNIIWLKGIAFLMALFLVIIAVQKGLSSGDAIFDMSDVNLLFVSPVNPRLILLYGIVRMAKMAFWAGFFILFQSNSLSNGFGVGYGGVLLLLLGFFLAFSLMQVLSLLIYVLTNGRPKRKNAVKLIAVAAFLPVIAYTGVTFAAVRSLLPALEAVLRSPVSTWAPVAGWASEGIVSLIIGNTGRGLLFFGLIILAAALIMLYIALSNPDYYEDVLVATETAFEKKRSASEGQLNPEASSKRKIHVSKTGIGGAGASAIFYKHLRESFRANRLGLWGLPSVFTVLGAAVMSLFLRGEGDGGGLLILLQILMWMQIFFIGTGRGLKELYMHYIYLIPESSFRKIVWSNLELALKILVESAVLFSVAGGILGASVPLILLSIALFTLFSFLLLGINYLSLRWTQADLSAGLLIIIYLIAVIVIMLPGLIPAIVVGSMLGDAGIYVGFGILSAWELLAALGCFALSRGILHRCDMPVYKGGRQR